ncbi:MAG: class I SAM-dependent methyltransferase [Blastocatellia bacterium]|nr:class I SAM-dependent methyltransferase [Blastocatellia bacterium]
MPLLPTGMRRRFVRAYWELRWKQDDPGGPWLDRDVSADIVQAVDGGWFAAGSPAIDVGCGRGDVAAWLASRGFPTVGVDIAPSAIALARKTHGEVPGQLEFVAADVCAEPLPDRRFGVFIDRGCFHQLDTRDRESFARNVAIAAAPGARFLLFVKAFRDGVPIGDPDERDRRTREVEDVFAGSFTIDRIRETHLDRFATLPGLVFWMTRRGE